MRARGYIAITVLGLALLGSAAGMGGYRYWTYSLERPIALNAPTVFEVQRGDGVRQMLDVLQSRGIIHATWPYKVLGWFEPHRLKGLRAGEFALTPGMNAWQLLEKLSSNDVVMYSVTVPEGRSFAQFRAMFDSLPKLEHRTIGLSEEAFMAAIGHGGERPEGRFFPTTYQYRKGMQDITLFKQAYDVMEETLHNAWGKRAADLPYITPYEALIMASLIEQETGVAEERREIAGVFIRRLKKGMRLQTDPAVAYGLSKYAKTLTRADLTTPTPFNTYMNDGLPPTPISLPGKASIDAALHPANGTSLYFVAKGDGGHRFSNSLDEHLRAVQDYLRQLKVTPEQPQTPTRQP